MNRADRAEELFRKGYNCSQSVFGAFNDVVGLDLDEAMKIASPFGAGWWQDIKMDTQIRQVWKKKRECINLFKICAMNLKKRRGPIFVENY